MKPLTRRQRAMLLLFLEWDDKQPRSWHAPCPRIGDLRVLAGLCKRKLVQIADHEIGYVPNAWPRWQRITDLGREVAHDLFARREGWKP